MDIEAIAKDAKILLEKIKVTARIYPPDLALVKQHSSEYEMICRSYCDFEKCKFADEFGGSLELISQHLKKEKPHATKEAIHYMIPNLGYIVYDYETQK